MDKEFQLECILQGITNSTADYSNVVQQLAPLINEYIQKDFEKLVQLLYRIDVDENKLKQALQENSGTDASHIIAGMVVERQLQKLKSRQMFRTGQPPVSEEDKW